MSDVKENATDDIRGAIQSAMSEVEKPEVEEIADEKVEETAEEKSTRLRDEKGRFAKKEVVDEVVTDGLIADGKPAEPTPSEAVDPEPVEPVEVIKPPQSWTAEAKEKFATLDPLLQKELIKRENDYSKGIQSKAEAAKWAEETKPIFEQWQPYLNQLGTTPQQAFQALIQAEYNLRNGSPQQKQQALNQLARDYGISLPQSGETQVQPDPTIEPIYNELNSVKQQLAQFQYQQKQEQQRIQQEQEAQMQSMITEFSSNPEYPHFEALRENMAQLLQAGVAESLEDAYSKAAWANPEIRSTLIKQEEAKRIKQQADIARSAKLKAVSVHGSPSGTETPTAELGIRDQLLKAMQGDGNRV